VFGAARFGCPLSVLRGACLSGQIAAALTFMHSRDVIHRDITSKNLLVKKIANRWTAKVPLSVCLSVCLPACASICPAVCLLGQAVSHLLVLCRLHRT
jgi:serine/threonine protein kinase